MFLKDMIGFQMIFICEFQGDFTPLRDKPYMRIAHLK